jgi:WhiB family redox-sensing transcriptional regulator
VPRQPDFIGHKVPCLTADPEVFFPTSSVGGLAYHQLAKAQAHCNRCPLQDECLGWALESGETYGVWGGVRLDGMHATTRWRMRERLRTQRRRSA